MEKEYLISGQPVEVLYKQLSEPTVTLQDIENFCISSRKARELCLTNPLFRELREGKRVAVSIILEVENYDNDNHAILLEFHHYFKTFQTTYTLSLSDYGYDGYFENNLNLVETIKKDGWDGVVRSPFYLKRWIKQ